MLCEQVLQLIFLYAKQMEALADLLREMNENYHFVEGASFTTLEDVLQFNALSEVEFPDVVLIKFSPTTCDCTACELRNWGVWIYSPGLAQLPTTLTIGSVLDFVKTSNLLCQHELVTGFAVHDESVTVLLKNVARGQISCVETQRPPVDDQDLLQQHSPAAED